MQNQSSNKIKSNKISDLPLIPILILAAKAKKKQPTKLQSNKLTHCSDLSRGRKFIEHLVREVPAEAKTEYRVGKKRLGVAGRGRGRRQQRGGEDDGSGTCTEGRREGLDPV
jgi:hypothetical protein